MPRCTTIVQSALLAMGLLAVGLLSSAPRSHAQVLAAPGPTAAAVKARGQLLCGVDTGLAGFAYQDGAGRWIGLDVDYCRAIAAAVLGNADQVRYVPTTSVVRFTLLQSGDIDVLLRDSTLTYTRDAQLGLAEVAVSFYAGQGFLVRKSLNVASAVELDGATICTLSGSTLELNIGDFARAAGHRIATLTFDKAEAGRAAAEAGRCDGYSDDTGSLAAVRSTMKVPDDWTILPEVISKEPLGPHVRQGDERWRDIVYWVDATLKTAEEYGITTANADESTKSANPAIRRFLGSEGGLTRLVGLDEGWTLRVIKAVGNYGEVYDRHFGPKALNLPRGQNNLWSHGGLQYALPFR